MRTSLVPILLAALGCAQAGTALAQDAAPEGDGCAAAIARWQEIAAREDKGGFMGEAVFAQIQGEIDRASGLCRAGRDAEARRAVTASMRRHGY